MIPTFIILFREVLEIAIILSIILAATRGVPGRNRWVWLGIAGGLAGSGLVALFASNIADAVEGMGQEVFNASVLFIASFMIGWTVVWMKTHGRELAMKFKQVGQAVREGDMPLYSVAIVISLAMWREGAEIVLFMTGILSTSEESLTAILAGGAAGGAVAAIIGTAIYLGLITLSTKHLFSTTGWLLTFLACGMSAQAVGYLSAADMLPTLGQAWDSSAILSEDSIVGKILHAMLGYTEQPTVMQVIAYVVTMLMIVGALRIIQKSGNQQKQTFVSAQDAA